MALYNLLAMDHDSGQELPTAEMAAPPRPGDEVLVTGPEYGSSDAKTGEPDTEVFHVISVIHEVQSSGDVDTTVHVLSEDHGRGFVPRCTCTADECMPLTDDTCDNCRGRLSRDRRRGARPVVDKEVDGLIDAYERLKPHGGDSTTESAAAAVVLADHLVKSRR